MNPFFYTYVLKQVNGNRLYIGHTTDINQRLEQHNSGIVTPTQAYRPWVLIYFEACLTEQGAIEREKQLKSGFGRAYLKRRLDLNDA